MRRLKQELSFSLTDTQRFFSLDYDDVTPSNEINVFLPLGNHRISQDLFLFYILHFLTGKNFFTSVEKIIVTSSCKYKMGKKIV
jgi:hypothetical protein